MHHSILGAGSLHKLSIQSVNDLLTDDIKPALANPKRGTFINIENSHTPNDARAGFTSTANYSTDRLYLQSVNEPAPTTTMLIHLQKEMK